MPRERAVSGMLKNSHEFEIQLFNFLGKDYDGLSPDRVALPDSESLMGKKGEFILYRLTCGPLFDSLQSSMHPLSIVGENLLAETPGKATFEWIRSAVSWIERLNDSLTTESPFEDNAGKILAIPGAEARDILKEGENFFLRIPEDLKKTLSNHGIFVSTNKQERTLRVIVKKDGAHHSVGGTVIRWCPILFDSLRADVNKFETWEKELMRVLAQFNSFFAGTRDHQKDDQEDLYMWYCFREQIEEILKEGKALIVSPQKSLAQSFQKMLESMKKYLEQHSKPEWDRAFAKKWFAQSTSLLDDRFHLLESLLHRNNISSKKPAEETRDLSPAHQPDRTFRDACRSYIEKSLKKALKTVGMVATTESNDESKEIESFCGIKAWEVETEMFEKFQDEFGLSRVSEEYRNKARNLRASLEDRNNASLCLRVLIGEIGVAKLVDMSSEELASHKAKLERARAEQKAKSFALLTPEVKDKKPDDTKEPNVQEIPESKVAGLVSSTATGGNDTNGVASAMTTETKKVDEVEAYDSSSPPPSPFLSLARSSNSASPTLPKELLSKSSRPPPPPSLAISLSQSSASETTNAAAKSADRGKRVETSSGGDKFRIEIGNPKVSFHAAFFLEDESQAGVSHFLPPVLTERGRLKIHEFSRFLSDKLSRGYLAIPLRLTTLSDQDAKEYRTFYKEYEMKERIAMFSVNGQNSKVFLVPPKFHGAAKKTGLVSLPNKTRTYAIVLTKEIGVLMN